MQSSICVHHFNSFRSTYVLKAFVVSLRFSYPPSRWLGSKVALQSKSPYFQNVHLYILPEEAVQDHPEPRCSAGATGFVIWLVNVIVSDKGRYQRSFQTRFGTIWREERILPLLLSFGSDTDLILCGNLRSCSCQSAQSELHAQETYNTGSGPAVYIQKQDQSKCTRVIRAWEDPFRKYRLSTWPKSHNKQRLSLLSWSWGVLGSFQLSSLSAGTHLKRSTGLRQTSLAIIILRRIFMCFDLYTCFCPLPSSRSTYCPINQSTRKHHSAQRGLGQTCPQTESPPTNPRLFHSHSHHTHSFVSSLTGVHQAGSCDDSERDAVVPHAQSHCWYSSLILLSIPLPRRNPCHEPAGSHSDRALSGRAPQRARQVVFVCLTARVKLRVFSEAVPLSVTHAHFLSSSLPFRIWWLCRFFSVVLHCKYI